MLHPADFYRLLEEKGVNFFTGVPDSLLKDFCAYLTDNVPGKNHIIAANEGNAAAIAAGGIWQRARSALSTCKTAGWATLSTRLSPCSIRGLQHTRALSCRLARQAGDQGRTPAY